MAVSRIELGRHFPATCRRCGGRTGSRGVGHGAQDQSSQERGSSNAWPAHRIISSRPSCRRSNVAGGLTLAMRTSPGKASACWCRQHDVFEFGWSMRARVLLVLARRWLTARPGVSHAGRRDRASSIENSGSGRVRSRAPRVIAPAPFTPATDEGSGGTPRLEAAPNALTRRRHRSACAARTRTRWTRSGIANG